ncbi:MAG: sulfite exporter TauE/SafE family protein [Alphaproteobacteria bacterium]
MIKRKDKGLASPYFHGLIIAGERLVVITSPSEFGFLAGLILGVAASLHCAGMCGGIATSLTMMLDPGTGTLGRARMLMLAQLARVLAYVTMGGLVGAFGSSLFGVIDQVIGFRVLQWAGAVSLVWIGASVAGFAPALTGLDAVTLPITRRLVSVGAAVGPASPIVLGALWGFLPCAMVYGALVTAMLSGSSAGGAATMAGFGLGTLPAVTLTALGLGGLKAAARGEFARRTVGVAIAATGLLGLVLSAPGGPLCITG